MRLSRAAWLIPAALFTLALPVLSAPADNSRWLARLGVDRAHAAGYRGKGVKVAVLDTGFRGWRSWVGTALPRGTHARSFRLDGQLESRNSPHGVLCGEVVHALAPDAELLFANWEPDRPDSFVQAVAWAKQQGARVLTCSVIMPAWSDGEGGGPVHAALSAVIGGGDQRTDMICCACAGNTAQRHWSGTHRPAGDGWHLWQPGQRDNLVTPWADEERVSVEICWSAGASYSVAVVDAVSGKIIGQSPTKTEPGVQSAVFRFAPNHVTQYAIRVRSIGAFPGSFHVATLGGWLGTYTERGSIPFPADGPEFLAIGAWEEEGRRASYSSCGPNSSSPKPDFVAPVPLATSVRERPFAGTSAAAPQAAGLAALCLSMHPDWTADQVRAALQAAAIDVATPGHDYETGYGVLRLPSQ